MESKLHTKNIFQTSGENVAASGTLKCVGPGRTYDNQQKLHYKGTKPLTNIYTRDFTATSTTTSPYPHRVKVHHAMSNFNHYHRLPGPGHHH